MSELQDDEEYLLHWTRHMSFDDKTCVIKLQLLESREFDFWTNRMMIDTLRDLADELEMECAGNEDESVTTVDH